MFRASIIQTVKKSLQSHVLSAKFCTKPTARHFNEINDVKIVGTLKYAPYKLPRGTTVLTVSTKDSISPVKYSTHEVHINTDASLAVGRQVCVTGKLKSIQKRAKDGTVLTIAVIKADQLLLLENENKLAQSVNNDANKVELLGFIASDVMEKELNSFLLMAIRYKYVDRHGEEVSGAHFHPVLAFDNAVRNYIEKTQLKKNDKILVQGQMGYKPFIDGRVIQTGFIFADNINRIARIFNANGTQHNENENKKVKSQFYGQASASLDSRHFEEFTRVNIIGTATTDPEVLQSRPVKLLTVKTKESSTKSSTHNIHIHSGMNVVAGQRVYISGKLRHTACKEDAPISIVKADQLYILENENAAAFTPTNGDMNNVELVGMVATDIDDKARRSSFSVATRYTRLNENEQKEAGEYLHQVVANDESICRYIRDNSLKKNDEVRIQGKIGYRVNTEADGKQTVHCIIVANNVYKVIDRIKHMYNK